MEKNQIIALVLVVILVGGFLGLVYISTKNQKSDDAKITGDFGYDSDESTSLSLPKDDTGSVTKPTETPKKDTPMANVKMSLEEKLALVKPTTTLESDINYQVILKTSEGDITIDVNEKETPITANNFVALAESGFYNDVIFHRVIDGFMIQSGDPKGDGTGGPAYKFDDEVFVGEYTRGTVAMANSGPDTNGSQFFIMHADNPLPKDYVIFGSVVSGLDVVDKIAKAPVKANMMREMSTPVNPVKILDVEVKKISNAE